MKIYIFVSICFIFGIIRVTRQTFANQDSIGVDLPIQSCLEKVDNSSTFDFKNWYSDHFSQEDMKKYLLEARKVVCGLYVSGGDITRIQLSTMLPIYSPRKEAPIGLQNIYVGQDYVYPERIGRSLWGGVITPLTNRRLFSHFQFGGFGGSIMFEDRIAYLKSLEEPFRSAPTLQMYTYLGSPLLVARSQTGIVTDVFFQRKNVTDPIVIAQKYLGDKWYHP